MNTKIKPNRYLFWAYLTPGILLFAFVVFLPIAGALYYSTFNWSGGPKMEYVGLSNYVAMLHDETFWKSFYNNLILTGVCLVGQIGFAFLLALALNSKLVKFKEFHRTVSYFPVTLSAVVIGFIWSMMYDYNYGLINYILRAVGLGSLAQPWLSSEKAAIFYVAIPLIWQFVGYYLVILLSGLSSIDPSVLEMADLDGVNAWQKARYITLPMLRKTMLVCITLCISGNMKAFDHIYVMTGGGPGTATTVMSLYAYNNSFIRYKMGYGSALSIGILVLSLAVTLTARRLFEGKRGKNE